eukprot:XP_001706576.1 Hypothetical protein GL50803_36119 [Giardia lamblia ATCC 50803]
MTVPICTRRRKFYWDRLRNSRSNRACSLGHRAPVLSER